MNAITPVPDAREILAREWASAQLQVAATDFRPASSDASFRRYFRLRSGEHSWIVMDAPPDREDVRPFVAVAAMMREAGLHVPRVLSEDAEQGLLLLSDLGRQTYLDCIDAQNADGYFDGAIDALVSWQRASRPGVLPPYDTALLDREVRLFPDWFLARHLGVQLDGEERAELEVVFTALIDAALAQPRGFVHRDYMPRNLMVSSPNPGVLDFQDAVFGPLAYDAICLFKDAFLSWPAERVEGWLAQYHRQALAAGVPVPPWPDFRRDCDWIGLHRHLKVLGVFARICHRDGKPKYVADAPRFVRYVMDVAPRYPEMAPLVALFQRHVLPRVPA